MPINTQLHAHLLCWKTCIYSLALLSFHIILQLQENPNTMSILKFYLYFLLLSTILVQFEARPYERKMGSITQSFRAILHRKILLEQGSGGDSGRKKVTRSSPGGPDPQHHFSMPMPWSSIVPFEDTKGNPSKVIL